MIRQTMFVIAVPDLERSAAFYRDVLGFQIRDVGDSGWRMYTLGACRIMAGCCPDAIAPNELGDHAYYGYFQVDDVEAYHRRAVIAQAEIVKALATEPWGMREFGLRTADGHRIMLGQSVMAP